VKTNKYTLPDVLVLCFYMMVQPTNQALLPFRVDNVTVGTIEENEMMSSKCSAKRALL